MNFTLREMEILASSDIKLMRVIVSSQIDGEMTDATAEHSENEFEIDSM